MLKRIILFVCLCLAVSVYAQDTAALPTPSHELPDVYTIIVGAVASILAEFIQKQKSPGVSLLIAVGASAIGGAILSFAMGQSLGDLPSLVAQTFAYASGTWALLFSKAGLKKMVAKG
jgi:uncharacterized membrane protein YeaQ/YmgE (transglycosylase-associated protein family)